MRTFFLIFPCMVVLLLSLSLITPVFALAQEKSPSSSVKEDSAQPQEKNAPAETTFLPRGNIFKPLLADPKEVRFYLGYRPYQRGQQYLTNSTQIFAGGLGDMFGLYRSVDKSGGYNWQVSISGGIYAEFDIDTSSFFMVSSDYTIGFPFTLRKGPASYRLTIYHQSAHVGDEYLLHSDIQRKEFSYEAINLIGSYEWATWRVYYGGEVMVHWDPKHYKPLSLQAGLEYYGPEKILLGGRLVSGLDLKCTQENDWPINTSIKLGLQFDGSAGTGRSIRFLLEGYNGFAPHGQFYGNRLQYVGIGLSLEFE